MKLCSICKTLKPESSFSPDSSAKDGRRGSCKFCHAEYKRSTQKAPISKEQRRKYRIKGRYGISLEEYNDLLVNQSGKCGICEKLPLFDPLCVDHDHNTGKVRGLLCSNCNKGVGLLQDSISVLSSAINYLSR